MKNSYLKELSNMDNEKVNSNNRNNIFIDAELNMIDKEIKEKMKWRTLWK